MIRLRRKAPLLVGCDIGTSTLNLIAFEYEKGSQWASLRANESHAIKDPNASKQAFQSALKLVRSFLDRLVDETGIPPSEMLVSLPHRMTELMPREIRFPRENPRSPVTSRELVNMLEAAKETCIPGKNSQEALFHVRSVSVDGYPVKGFLPSQGSDVSVAVTAALVPKPVSREFEKMTGAFPGISVELVSRAVAVSHYLLIHEGPEVSGICIDIGAKDSCLMLFSGGVMNFMRVFPFGGADLTNAIHRERKVSPRDAELLKRQWARGVLHEDEAAKLQKAVEAELLEWKKAWAEELARWSSFAVIPSKILLTGGASMLPRVSLSLAEEEWFEPLATEGGLDVRLLHPEEKELAFFANWPFASSGDAVLFSLVSRMIHKENSGIV